MKTYTAHVSLHNGVTLPVQVKAASSEQARRQALEQTFGAVGAVCKSETERAADWLAERILSPFPLIGGAR